MTLLIIAIFGISVLGLDGLAHTLGHSVVTITPSVSDAKLLIVLCEAIDYE